MQTLRVDILPPPSDAGGRRQPERRPHDVYANAQEIGTIAALPVAYWLLAPALGVHPVFNWELSVGGAFLVMVVLIWIKGIWGIRPQAGPDGRRTFTKDGRSLTRTLLLRAWDERWHWIRGALLLALAVAFLDVYAAYKQAIPRFASYQWDPLFSRLDRALHGGIDPWQYFRAVLERRPLMLGLDTLYWLWSAVSIGFVALAAWSRSRRLRVRFMLTFFGTWIIGGTILAAAFASGGPVYFEKFVPNVPTPYEPLMAILRETGGLAAVKGHDGLWLGFSRGGHPRTSGISAMPSMHVAMATLCVVLASSYNRAFVVATVIYAALITVGSIVLAWHYAIDAYASIALVLFLWWLAGRVAGPGTDFCPVPLARARLGEADRDPVHECL